MKTVDDLWPGDIVSYRLPGYTFPTRKVRIIDITPARSESGSRLNIVWIECRDVKTGEMYQTVGRNSDEVE